MNKPIDWTKPLETIGRYSARYLGKLEGVGLIYPHVVAITQNSFNEYTARVADDGTWLGHDGERVPYIVNKVTKREVRNFMYYNLDDDGNAIPCSGEEWHTVFLHPKRHVGSTRLKDSLVSTVFLGLDHQYGDGPPLIFETMIFGGREDGYQDRCTTRQEAVQMHQKACVLVLRPWILRVMDDLLNYLKRR